MTHPCMGLGVDRCHMLNEHPAKGVRWGLVDQLAVRGLLVFLIDLRKEDPVRIYHKSCGELPSLEMLGPFLHDCVPAA